MSGEPIPGAPDSLNEWLEGNARGRDKCHRDAHAAIAAVEALHRPVTIETLDYACSIDDCDHEDDCPTPPQTVCAACLAVVESITDEQLTNETMWPCVTARALIEAAPKIGGGTSEESP